MQPGDDRELTQNGGFEQPGSPVPEGWTWDVKQTGSKGRIVTDTGAFHSGRASLKLEPNQRNGGDQPLAVSQIINGAPYRGKKIRFSAYMKADGGAAAVIAMLSIVRGKPTNLVGDAQPTGGREWVEHTKEYDVPDDPSVQLVLICSVNGHSGAAWFDDVSVRRAGEEAGDERPPQPTVLSAAPLAASITVDAGQVIRQIPRTLFGADMEWIWNGNFMWNNGKADPRLTKLTREMGVTLIRYPGGSYSDFYHWKDGIGPVEKRPQMAHDGTGKDRSRPDFGTDEALEFAKEVGAELLITVNAGTGTAQEAADWVRYVNRNRLNVRYWEVGNELYINDGSPTSKAIAVDPVTYARRFREFAQAMKAAYPGIKIGAIGGENQGPYALVQYPNWNKTVLEQAGNQMDFLAVHNAYAPVNVSDSQDLRSVYRAMFAAPVLIARNLANIARQAADFGQAREGPIQIAVTEWGPFFQVDPKGAYAQHTKTLGSALFAASALKTLIESPTTTIANIHVLNDLGFMGWIGSMNNSFPPHPEWTPTARYYSFVLFSEHFGTQLVRSDTNSPTYDSDAAGFLVAVKDVPYLDIVSSLSADGRQLFIIGINKNPDNSVDASIALRDFAPARSATAWTLNGTGLDANTGTRPVQIPGLVWGKQVEDRLNPRFSKGGPDEITFSSATVEDIKDKFNYRFPAHSATSLVLTRQ